MKSRRLVAVGTSTVIAVSTLFGVLAGVSAGSTGLFGVARAAVGVAATTPSNAVWDVVATIGVGNGAKEIGYSPSSEGGIARGPQALSLAPDGTLYLLDSVHRQIDVVQNGGVARTISVDSVYPREILATASELYVLDDSNRVIVLDSSGTLDRKISLPPRLPTNEVYRLVQDANGTIQVWADGYQQFPLSALPQNLDVRAVAENEAIGNRGVTSPTGKKWAGALISPLGAAFFIGGGATRVPISTHGLFGDARLAGFDAAGDAFVVVDDLFDNAPRMPETGLEMSVRRYDSAGQMTGAARIPFERFVLSPRRVVEPAPDGSAYVLVPTATAAVIYHVRLGADYQSQIPTRVMPNGTNPPRPNGLASARADITDSRHTVYNNAWTMANSTWAMHATYDYFPNSTTSRYNVSPAADRPLPMDSATENATLTGIPYTYGGFDSPWSHSDSQAWTNWNNTSSGALYYYRNLSQNGPVVGNIGDATGIQWYSGTAGIDCSGFVYAAAGYTSNPKPGTSTLINTYGNSLAGYDAGWAGNVQPMDYFVRDDASVKHTFYYEYRKLDATGIWTLEATMDGNPQAAKEYGRTWSDVNSYYQRSWWAFVNGDTAAKAITSSGPGSACDGVRGQNVWYKFTTSSATTVTLTSISGGNPDLWILDTNFNTVGTPSTNGGTSNESVSLSTAGTYYAMVHIYASNGGCTYFTIGW